MDSIDLNTPIYLIDFEATFSDLLDYLNFSEKNLDWQKRVHDQTLRREFDANQLEADEYFFQLQIIEHRFGVSLPWRIRYAALTALVTTMEWAAKFLEKYAAVAVPTRPSGANDSIHILQTFAERSELDFQAEIEDLKSLIYVRNCIVHNAGLLDGYEHAKPLRLTLSAMRGFGISDANLIGDAVAITEGAIQDRITRMKAWLLALLEKSRTAGHIKLPEPAFDKPSVRRSAPVGELTKAQTLLDQ